MRKNFTVTDDGHIMRASGSNGIDTMISESHDSNIEVDGKTRIRIMNSGDTKKKMATRRCFDNSKNHRSRVMSNTGEVTIHGTFIDTSKASDGEFKNSRCVSTRNDSELLSAKRDRFVDMMMKLRK
tara:strand:- start:12 stop:389 length:378 start_codon:yes stop_codon:yes gene_type:complete